MAEKRAYSQRKEELERIYLDKKEDFEEVEGTMKKAKLELDEFLQKSEEEYYKEVVEKWVEKHVSSLEYMMSWEEEHTEDDPHDFWKKTDYSKPWLREGIVRSSLKPPQGEFVPLFVERALPVLAKKPWFKCSLKEVFLPQNQKCICCRHRKRDCNLEQGDSFIVFHLNLRDS